MLSRRGMLAASAAFPASLAAYAAIPAAAADLTKIKIATSDVGDLGCGAVRSKTGEFFTQNGLDADLSSSKAER